MTNLEEKAKEVAEQLFPYADTGKLAAYALRSAIPVILAALEEVRAEALASVDFNHRGVALKVRNEPDSNR
jgi:hypothetical protein